MDRKCIRKRIKTAIEIDTMSSWINSIYQPNYCFSSLTELLEINANNVYERLIRHKL